MIHSREKGGCDTIVNSLSRKTRITNYLKLHTVREFKKVRTKYFTDEMKEWDVRVEDSLTP